jgi:hypothetical protein
MGMIMNLTDRKVYYVPPAELEDEYEDSLKAGEPSRKLVEMFYKISRKYASSSQFVWNCRQDFEACVSFSVIRAWEKWDKFDYDRSDNHFAFFTQMIKCDLVTAWNDLNSRNKNSISIDSLYTRETC